MSFPPGIDRDEQESDKSLFQFDPYHSSRLSPSSVPSSPVGLSSSDGQSLLANGRSMLIGGDGSPEGPPAADLKGKGVSKPMPIRTVDQTSDHDVFGMPMSMDTSPSIGSAIEPTSSSSFTAPPAQADLFARYSTPTVMAGADGQPIDDTLNLGDAPGKGKGKELPPTLPPFTFPSTGLVNTDPSSWTSSYIASLPIAGPSSYGSLATTDFGTYCSSLDSECDTWKWFSADRDNDKFSSSLKSRKSSMSFQFTNPEHAGIDKGAIEQFELLFGKKQLVQKSLFDKSKSVSLPAIPIAGISFEGSPFHIVDSGLNSNRQYPSSRIKGRSRSSPYPLSAEAALRSKLSLSDFNDRLPREIQLKIFSTLVILHARDHQRLLANGDWTVSRAASSKNRWVGANRGLRDLVKMTRVCKSWQSLMLDGQLWADLDLKGFPKLPEALVTRLTSTAGTFIRRLNLPGYIRLQPRLLLDIADHLNLQACLPASQLTDVNFEGCSSLSTRSLNNFLIHCRNLTVLRLKGLGAVTNTTCDILASYCPEMDYLNLSRCRHMDANGIRRLGEAALARADHLKLRKLYLSGLKRVDDDFLAVLGRAAPYLEVLDLSYSSSLHNSALEAFVACHEADSSETLGVDIVSLSACEAGRDVGDYCKYRRRVTHLRHLCLSACTLLTDTACSNLAHSVPHLEYLELASIGDDLKDDGLIHLLGTTPKIRRLDLEDASSITDLVLNCITPVLDGSSKQADAEQQSGYALEELIVSYAVNLTDDALLALIKSCTRLKSLEADNTRIGSAVTREFVNLCLSRKMVDSRLVAIDCRGVGESLVKEMAVSTRPRKGMRTYEARKLKYVDGRDESSAADLKIGQDECDETKTVLKSFHSWQTVDAVQSGREKRRKDSSKRRAKQSSSSSTETDDQEYGHGRSRWWRSSHRRFTLNNGAQGADANGDGCFIM